MGRGMDEDGAIWGSEFLLASYASYQRFAHLTYVPLPGGDQAARQPWRMALAWLNQSGLNWDEELAPVQHASTNDSPIDRLQVLRHQLESGLEQPADLEHGTFIRCCSRLIGHPPGNQL